MKDSAGNYSVFVKHCAGASLINIWAQRGCLGLLAAGTSGVQQTYGKIPRNSAALAKNIGMNIMMNSGANTKIRA